MNDHRRLIIGGHNIRRRRYPYFVSIDKNNGVIVSGALIPPDIVLSAGHVALDNVDNLTLKVGPHSMNETESFAEEIPIEQRVLPPDWSVFPFANECMIFKLSVRLTSQSRSTLKPSNTFFWGTCHHDRT